MLAAGSIDVTLFAGLATSIAAVVAKEERALFEGAAKEAKVRLWAWIRDTPPRAAGKG